MDNLGSHKTLNAFNICKANGVHVVSLPPHTSNKLQPLDVTFFGGLKTAYNSECDKFMRTNKFEKITPYDVAHLFNKAYIRVATLEKGISGFKRTGIYPFNPDAYTREELEVAQPLIPAVNMELNVDDCNIDEAQIDCQPDNQTSTIVECSFAAVSPYLKAKENSTTKPKTDGRRKQKSIIFTDTPLKFDLEAAEEKKKAKKAPKIKIACRKKKVTKKIVFSSSDESDHPPDKTFCDDDELDDINPSTNSEICFVCGEFGKDGETWFRCVFCGSWAHKDCTGAEKPDEYACDFCVDAKRSIEN